MCKNKLQQNPNKMNLKWSCNVILTDVIKQTCDKVIVITCIQLLWNSGLASQAKKSQFYIITFLGNYIILSYW